MVQSATKWIVGCGNPNYNAEVKYVLADALVHFK